MTRKNAIDVQGLCYSYDKKNALIENVTFSIPEGSIVTILGKNGVGKTTLLNCFLGLIRDYSGTIHVLGKNLLQYSRKELAQVIGLVPQLGQASFDYTVEEFVLMGCAAKIGYFAVPGNDAHLLTDETLETLGIHHLKKRSVNALSGGERQLVYIARTLLQRPNIIVMDEPTSALDFGNSIVITDLICKLRELGYTVILTCHNPDYPFIFRDHTIAMFPEHTLRYGKSEDILSDETLSSLYGVGVKRVFLSDLKQYVCVKSSSQKVN